MKRLALTMLAMLAAYRPAAGLNRQLFLALMVAAGIGTVLAAGYFLVNVVLVSVVLALANQERLLPSVAGHLRDEISMTTMLPSKPDSWLRKYATALPITAPPTMATSWCVTVTTVPPGRHRWRGRHRLQARRDG